MIDDILTDENAVFFHPQTEMALSRSGRLATVCVAGSKPVSHFYDDDPEYPGKVLGTAFHLKPGIGYRRISPKPIGKADYGVQSYIGLDGKNTVVRISYDNQHMEFPSTLSIAEMKRRFEAWYLVEGVKYIPINFNDESEHITGCTSKAQSHRVGEWYKMWMK